MGVACEGRCWPTLYTFGPVSSMLNILDNRQLNINSPSLFVSQEAEGVVMGIPMPGHPVPSQEEDSVLQDCRRLQVLIDSHDAIFLLTDTRESRWLPTLFCANSNKVDVFYPFLQLHLYCEVFHRFFIVLLTDPSSN